MDLAIVIAVVVVALVFDYTNGFHDAANAIATSVSTRALTPRVALMLAAVMNFVGALPRPGGRPHGQRRDRRRRAATHGLVIVLAGLLGAIAWNLITWYFGLPSSSSHALIGGLVGAALAAGATVHWTTIIDKVVIPMVRLADRRLRRWRSLRDAGDHVDLPARATRTGSSAASGWRRPSRPPRWRSATASRTPRRRWA